jgi:hypothetical protein
MKGLQRSLKNAQKNVLQNRTVRLNKLAIAIADGAPGYGTAVIGGLPEGNILFMAAVGYLQFTSSDADLTATFDGDFSVGTVATADGDVSDANEADILPSTAMGAATAKLSPVIRSVSTDALGGLIIDNTAATLELNLNVLIDDAAISGAVDMTATGYIDLVYIVMGDD